MRLCEIEGCGVRAVAVLQRRIVNDNFKGTTLPDETAPEHPRCKEHLAPGDAWLIDGMKPQVARFWEKSK
jgi:hypothetical protein